MIDEIDPALLSINERLTQYPDSYTDEELRDIMSWYEGRPGRGLWASFPAKAFLILEEREKKRNEYTKGKRHGNCIQGS